MAHPLFVQAGKQRGLRQLAWLRAHGRVRDALGPRVGVTSNLTGNVLEISFGLRRAAWWWLGLAHLVAWRRAKRAARAALRECKTDVLLRKVRPWRKNTQTSPSRSGNSTRSPGASYETP